MTMIFCRVTRWYLDINPTQDEQTSSLSLRAHAASDDGEFCELTFSRRVEGHTMSPGSVVGSLPPHLARVAHLIESQMQEGRIFGFLQYHPKSQDSHEIYHFNLPTSDSTRDFLIGRMGESMIVTELAINVGYGYEEAIQNQSIGIVDDWKIWQRSDPPNNV